MWRLCSHISPPSRWPNDSASCTFDSRSDFTSEPRSTMPASNESSMWKLWRAARLDATITTPSGCCCFATAHDDICAGTSSLPATLERMFDHLADIEHQLGGVASSDAARLTDDELVAAATRLVRMRQQLDAADAHVLA